MANALLITVALLLAALRIGGVTHEAYQAAAHLFVGGLFASSYMQHRYTWAGAAAGGDEAMLKGWLAIGLSIVELFCFIAMK